MRGNILCLLILSVWIPIVLYIFSKYKPRDAVIFCFFGALMFLPMEKLNIPLIIYNKMTATAIGVMIAIKVFDEERLESFSFHPVDIPVILWCISGFIASVTNGLGPKDGIQESFNTFTQWGIPYFVGRLYFSSPEGLKSLCRALFMACLIYIPFILFELKMSPQAHRIVYGYMQHDFSQVIRGSGYRPMVFMQHGIMLGTLMAMASLVAIWCTYAKVFPKKIWGVPTILLVIILVCTTVACKSSGAIGLLILGFFALFISSKIRIGVLVWALLLIPSAYIGTRATGYWDGQNLVNLVSDKFSEDRALSLAFRFDNENILVEKALERQPFGWGGWGRSRVYDEEGEDISTTDGFWIITLGRRGYFGLLSVSLMFFLPIFLFVLKCPPRLWGKPEYAPTAVLAIITLLFLIDCMLNAMVNQIYLIFAGGVSGMLAMHGVRLLEESGVPDTVRKTLLRPQIVTWFKRIYSTERFRKDLGVAQAEYGTRPLSKLSRTRRETASATGLGTARFREESKDIPDLRRARRLPRPLLQPRAIGSEIRIGIGSGKYTGTRFLTK